MAFNYDKAPLTSYIDLQDVTFDPDFDSKYANGVIGQFYNELSGQVLEELPNELIITHAYRMHLDLKSGHVVIAKTRVLYRLPVLIDSLDYCELGILIRMSCQTTVTLLHHALAEKGIRNVGYPSLPTEELLRELGEIEYLPPL